MRVQTRLAYAEPLVAPLMTPMPPALPRRVMPLRQRCASYAAARVLMLTFRRMPLMFDI